MSRVVGKIDDVYVMLRRIAAAGSAVLLLFATGCGSDSNDAKKENSATVNLEATVVTVTNPGDNRSQSSHMTSVTLTSTERWT